MKLNEDELVLKNSESKLLYAIYSELVEIKKELQALKEGDKPEIKTDMKVQNELPKDSIANENKVDLPIDIKPTTKKRGDKNASNGKSKETGNAG